MVTVEVNCVRKSLNLSSLWTCLFDCLGTTIVARKLGAIVWIGSVLMANGEWGSRSLGKGVSSAECNSSWGMSSYVISVECGCMIGKSWWRSSF